MTNNIVDRNWQTLFSNANELLQQHGWFTRLSERRKTGTYKGWLLFYIKFKNRQNNLLWLRHVFLWWEYYLERGKSELSGVIQTFKGGVLGVGFTDTCAYKNWAKSKISAYYYIYVACVLNHVWLLETPWTAACQTPLSIQFFQARILEWVAISSKGSSQPRDQTWVHCVSCTDRQILYHCILPISILAGGLVHVVDMRDLDILFLFLTLLLNKRCEKQWYRILLFQFCWNFLVHEPTPTAWPQDHFCAVNNDYYCSADVIVPSHSFSLSSSCTMALSFTF